MSSLALKPNYCAKTLEPLQQRVMKIIFSAVKDYTLSLIFANVDTLESRREQLTAEIVLPTLPASGQAGLLLQTDYATQKNSSKC